MRKLFGLSPITRWGIVLVRVEDDPRVTSYGTPWLDSLFNDADGVQAYFRSMSGNRADFSARVFAPAPMYTTRKKKELMGAGGATAESAYLRGEARGKGIPTGAFDRFVWVIDTSAASGGTASAQGDVFIAARHVTQQLLNHEIAHTFGTSEGAAYVDGQVTTYGDPFCAMDNGPIARSFQNPAMAYLKDGRNHQTTGPVMCLPHLAVMQFLDQKNIVIRGPQAPAETFQLAANQGAPVAGDNRKVGLVVAPVEANQQSVEFWIEYRVPRGYDRRLDRPVWSETVDLPNGALVMHEQRPSNHTIYVSSVPVAVGQVLRVPSTSRVVEIIGIDPVLERVTLRFRPA